MKRIARCAYLSVFVYSGVSILWSQSAIAQNFNDIIRAKNVAGNAGVFATRTFPSNYTMYGLTIREYTGNSDSAGGGVFITCDSSEVAVGGFCEEKENRGEGSPNALLTAGVATSRSVACRWKNPGQYRVVASCLAISALRGDVDQGNYSQNQQLAK